MRVKLSIWLSTSIQFDSNILQLLGMSAGQILVPPVTQLFRSKWLHFFFQCSYLPPISSPVPPPHWTHVCHCPCQYFCQPASLLGFFRSYFREMKFLSAFPGSNAPLSEVGAEMRWAKTTSQEKRGVWITWVISLGFHESQFIGVWGGFHWGMRLGQAFAFC